MGNVSITVNGDACEVRAELCELLALAPADDIMPIEQLEKKIENLTGSMMAIAEASGFKGEPDRHALVEWVRAIAAGNRDEFDAYDDIAKAAGFEHDADIIDLDGLVDHIQGMAVAREDALKTALAAAGRLADIAKATGFNGNPGELVAHVALFVDQATSRIAALAAEVKRLADTAGIPGEQRLALEAPSPSGVTACQLPEEAPAEAAPNSSGETPAPSDDAPQAAPDVSEATGLSVGENEELTAPSGKRVFLTRLSNAVGYLEHYAVTTPRKREIGTLSCTPPRGTWGAVVGDAGSTGYATHLEALNWLYRQDKHTAGEAAPEPPAADVSPEQEQEVDSRHQGPLEAGHVRGPNLPIGTRVKVDTVGFAGYGVIVQVARIGQQPGGEPDGYVVETQSGKRVMALWSACVEAPLPPVEEPVLEAPAAEEPQVDDELAGLRAQLEQMPAATLTPDEPVVILIEDAKRLATGVIVRQFEGSSRYTVKKDGGGMEVVDASLIRHDAGQRVDQAEQDAPPPADGDTPPWEGDEPQGDGDRLVTKEEREALGAFAASRNVLPARISALIKKHFEPKIHSRELTVSELAQLRDHIEAEAAAHVF